MGPCVVAAEKFNIYNVHSQNTNHRLPSVHFVTDSAGGKYTSRASYFAVFATTRCSHSNDYSNAPHSPEKSLEKRKEKGKINKQKDTPSTWSNVHEHKLKLRLCSISYNEGSRSTARSLRITLNVLSLSPNRQLLKQLIPAGLVCSSGLLQILQSLRNS